MPRSSQKLAFQGERGAFSYSAALRFVGEPLCDIPCPSFRDVFEKLRTGAASYAVVPIENTLHGSVHENYDNLLEYGFPITAETSVRIAHHLIVLPGVKFRDIKRAYSHPVALNQCREFFKKNPQIEPVSFYDTAGSVKMLAEQAPPQTAAIASEAAAGIFNAKIVRRNIEDDPQNYTRFFLLTKQDGKVPTATGPWKTSLVFSTHNTPGSLFRALACFALRDLSLSKIESRPLRGKPWEYLFYVDLIGRSTDLSVRNAISNLQETTEFLRVLGSYRAVPKA